MTKKLDTFMQLSSSVYFFEFSKSSNSFLVSLRTLQTLHAIHTIFSWVPRNVGSLQRYSTTWEDSHKMKDLFKDLQMSTSPWPSIISNKIFTFRKRQKMPLKPRSDKSLEAIMKIWIIGLVKKRWKMVAHSFSRPVIF